MSLISGLCIAGTIAMGERFEFDPYSIGCQITNGLKKTDLAIYVVSLIFIFVVVPVICIIAANLAILVLVARARGGVPGINAVKTVSCVSWAFLISVIPSNVRLIIEMNNVSPAWFDMVAWELMFMNAVVNPIIYTATSRSFRTFLINLVSRNKK